MFEKEIKKFRELFHIGISSLKEAARVYVSALDHDTAAKEIFQAANPEVPLTAWASLEKIGRGQMHEKLFLMCGRIQAALRSLSLSEQTEAIEKGVPVLLHDGSSMMMKPEAMTQSQQTQVFFNGAIRDLESQRAWMESQKNYRLPRNPLASGGYKVEGSLLVVSVPMTFSLEHLREIIGTMESVK